MSDNNGNEPLRIGVYVCHCGSNIAGVIGETGAENWEEPLWN